MGNVAGMGRPLRIERAGGWYHVTGRGNERKAIFRDNRDRFRLIGLLYGGQRVCGRKLGELAAAAGMTEYVQGCFESDPAV